MTGIGKKQFQQNMQGINQSYNNAAQRLEQSYNNTIGQLEGNYRANRSQLQRNANNSLKEAYVKNMQNQKNFGQNMASQGLTGGASQSALASMANNYSSGRNTINENTQNNLANLQQNYQKQLTDAANQYNSGLTQLELQRLNAEMNQRNQYAQYQVDTSQNYGGNGYGTGNGGGVDTRGGSGKTPKQPLGQVTPSKPNDNNVGNVGGVQINSVDSAYNPQEQNKQTTSIVNALAQQMAAGKSVTDIRKAAYNAVLSGQITDPTTLVNIFNALGITA